MPHENKPPVHFSESDPWRVYRLALRRAELARLPPPRHYSKQDPWREYRFALRRVSERLRSGHDLVLHSHHGPTARNSLGGSSNYRGVVWDFASQAWRAKIKYHGKTWYLGTHRLETDAAMAYDAASWFIMGAMAVVNFPGNDYDVIELPRPPPQWLVASLLKASSEGKDALSPAFRRWYARDSHQEVAPAAAAAAAAESPAESAGESE